MSPRDMTASDRIRGLVGAFLVLVAFAGCRREVSTEPHIPEWVPVPEGVEMHVVNWRVRKNSVEGTAIGSTELDGDAMQRFYAERMRAQGFEVQASPILQGGDFAQLFAHAPRRDRGLNVALTGGGSLILTYSQER